uniref:Uncharacterized protein n=1 Tax=Glossina pallidipes TaxID=7398 RepID=A0A1A9ZX00_GLOPL
MHAKKCLKLLKTLSKPDAIVRIGIVLDSIVNGILTKLKTVLVPELTKFGSHEKRLHSTSPNKQIEPRSNNHNDFNESNDEDSFEREVFQGNSKGGIGKSKGGIVYSKGGIANSKGGIANSKGGIANSKRGIAKSKGGIPNSEGGIAKSKGGIANSKGGIANSKGGIANSKRGIAKSKGSIANSKGGIANSKRGIANSKGGIANSKGSIGKSTGGIANSKGGIANSKGGIANSKGSIGKSTGGIAKSKGGIANSKGVTAPAPDYLKTCNLNELYKSRPHDILKHHDLLLYNCLKPKNFVFEEFLVQKDDHDSTSISYVAVGQKRDLRYDVYENENQKVKRSRNGKIKLIDGDKDQAIEDRY